MSTFFHGWRRKMGCVTLVIACVVMGGWMRSTEWLDAIDPDSSLNFAGGIRIVSGSGRIAIIPQTQSYHLNTKNGPNISYHGQYFGWVAWRGDSMNTKAKAIMVVPYWLIAVPLTILSAYLLLTTPRVTSSAPKIVADSLS